MILSSNLIGQSNASHRSTCPEVFRKKVYLKNFWKALWKHPWWSLVLVQKKKSVIELLLDCCKSCEIGRENNVQMDIQFWWTDMVKTTLSDKKFSIKDFFSKCDQIRSFLRIWSHLLKKSLMENFIFCAVTLV